MKTLIFTPFLILFAALPNVGRTQLFTVSGYITNYITGNAVENAAVFDSVSGIGTITNKDGFYKLMLAPGNMEIIFSDPGLKSFTQQFTLVADTTLNIKLKPQKLNRSKQEENHESDIKEKEKSHSVSKKF